MGQKKVNKANDAYSLKKAKGQSNKKGNTFFSNKLIDRPNHQPT